LELLWGRLKQTIGIPSPASTVSLESSVIQVHEGHIGSFRQEGGIYRVAVIDGAILARTGEGEIVKLDWQGDTILKATADERSAYLRGRKLVSDGTWSFDDTFLKGTAAATTMNLADGRYRVSSFTTGRLWTYQLFGRGAASIIATIDEDPHWCFDP
jgi:hypothetical protein